MIEDDLTCYAFDADSDTELEDMTHYRNEYEQEIKLVTSWLRNNYTLE